MRTRLQRFLAASGLVCLISSFHSFASAQTVTETAQQALAFSPEIQNLWHSFLGTEDDLESAEAGYRPTLDFYANYGREYRSGSGWTSGTKSPFNGGRAEIEFVQMLYDGFLTTGRVENAESRQLASYFQLLQQAQDTALQSYSAHLDVTRARQLLQLASENLEAHRRVYRQIQQSSEAGVSNSADLDQITGRLSLAHANVISARQNLQTIQSRYRRVVGIPASQNLQTPDLLELPESLEQARRNALEQNPEFLTALYQIQASEASVDASRSGFHPKLDFTARYGVQDYDDRGLDNSKSDGRIALELHYNLYNGGRDRAAVKKAYTEVNRAKANRDNVCYSVRQNVEVAWQELQKATEQLPVLRQHMESAGRVRRAYQEQFLVGRRSLLDVLDAENEHFQASQSYINAKYDQLEAAARMKATIGTLLSSLNVVRKDLPALSEITDNAIVVKADSACPDNGNFAFRESQPW